MRTARKSPIAADLKRLRALRVPTAYVRDVVLPEWWDDAAATSPIGKAEFHLIVAECLGIDFASLRDPQADLAPTDLSGVKFKLTGNTTQDQVAVTSAIAMQIARHAEVAGRSLPEAREEGAATIRDEVLSERDSWVDFDGLLDWCWNAGIPVLHLSKLPKTLRKMHGMAVKVAGRPLILLCKNQRQPAWQLFILAHELGHLMLGHVADDEALFDQEVRDGVAQDQEELDANTFALELLCGDGDTRVQAADRWPKAPQLAEAALRYGQRHRIDPGHVALNFAFSASPDGKLYPLANAALKILDPGADAPAQVRDAAVARLDWSALPANASAYLMRVMGVE